LIREDYERFLIFPCYFSLDMDAHKAYIMRMIINVGGVANDAEE
jgi:hypothetical protein